MISAEIQERYLQDSLPTRLGGLAANLARIVSFSKNAKATRAIESLIEESRWFIEWSAPELLPNRVNDAAYLVEVHRGLTHWYWIWNQVRDDPIQRQKLAEQAQEWSIEILYMSGLVEE